MNDQIKKMAELLRSGATMLQDACPVCNSPLFKVDGKTLCAKCGYTPASSKKVSTRPDSVMEALAKLNLTVARKVDGLEVEIANTTDLDKLSKLAELALVFLRILYLLDEFGEESSGKVE